MVYSCFYISLLSVSGRKEQQVHFCLCCWRSAGEHWHRHCHFNGSGTTCKEGSAPLRATSHAAASPPRVFFFFQDPSFWGCTDGRCSFIHKGDSKFYLVLNSQHVSDWHGGRVGGMERAEWEVVLPARDTNRSPRLFSVLLSPSGSLSIMHECQIQ